MTTAAHCLCPKTAGSSRERRAGAVVAIATTVAGIVRHRSLPGSACLSRISNGGAQLRPPLKVRQAYGVIFAAHVARPLVLKPAIITAPCMSMPPLLPTRQHSRLNFTSKIKAGFTGLRWIMICRKMRKHRSRLRTRQDRVIDVLPRTF